MKGLVIRMLLDTLCWMTLVFMSHQAQWFKTAVVCGVIGVVVVLLEVLTIFQIKKKMAERAAQLAENDPANWDDEAWAEFHREMSEHKDYDDRQDSAHFEA